MRLQLLVSVLLLAEYSHTTPVIDSAVVVEIRQINRVRRSDDGTKAVFPYRFTFDMIFEDGRTERFTLNKSGHNFQSFGKEERRAQLDDVLGVYQNVKKHTSMVVDCSTITCTLQGSLVLDGKALWIEPEYRGEDSLHRLTEKKLDDLKFGDDGIMPPAMDMMEVTGTSHHTNERVRRSEDSDSIAGCNVIESIAMVDHTIWDFWLEKASNNETYAEKELIKYYTCLYTEADARFHNFKELSAGTCNECIRVYLVDVVIQKVAGADWTTVFQSSGQLGGVPGLNQCGKQRRNLLKTRTFDHLECFTRLDIFYDGSFDHRGTSYLYTTCDAEMSELYAISVMESRGDSVDLLLAHELAHSIGAAHDSKAGCSDGEKYIMSTFDSVASNPSSYYNSWWFSLCSLNALCQYIDKLDAQGRNCLKTNDVVTQALFSKQLNTTSEAAGNLDLDAQCELNFGSGSFACEEAQYPENICELGIKCSANDGNCTASTSTTRVSEGTPCAYASSCLLSRCTPNPESGLDAPCVLTSQCADGNAICNTVSGFCECKAGFFNATGGSCQPQVGLSGGACTVNAQCADENAECNTGSSQCVCKSGFHSLIDVCTLTGVNLGDINCISGSCVTVNAECLADTCQCSSGYAAVDDACKPGVFGDACESFPETCSETNTECQNGVCSCIEYTTRVGSDCLFGLFSEACTTSPDTCTEPNTECNDTCVCIAGTQRADSTCVFGNYGEVCNLSPDTCTEDNTECVNDTATSCDCISGTRRIDGSCSAGNFYDNCLTNDPTTCTEINTECVDGMCKCSGSVRRTDTDTCAVGLNETCTDGIEGICFDQNAGCTDEGSGFVCTCNKNYAKDDDKCIEGLDLNEPCDPDIPNICKVRKSECYDDGGFYCYCKEKFTPDGNTCVRRALVGETCDPNVFDICDDLQSECIDNAGFKCECKENRIEVNGICLIQSNLGETCDPVINDICAVTQSECVDDDGFTCQCKQNFTEINDTCIKQPNLGETCDPAIKDICAVTQSECVDDDGFTCQCKKRYTDSNGTCIRQSNKNEVCDPTIPNICFKSTCTEVSTDVYQCQK